MTISKALLLWFSFVWLIISCGGGEKINPDPDAVTAFAPEKVSKTYTMKVYAHLMPWFDTKETNNGQWGAHWTMATKNPDDIVDTLTGRRDIASYFYPLIGPYASGDKHVIEYQLLLMKLSGIDGVLIDWYGTQNIFDYPVNLRNSESFISVIEKTGLEYAIVYEDQVNKNVSGDKIAAARSDMSYMESKYFPQKSYIRIADQPLLLTFGPQVFTSPSEWTNIFSGLTVKPKFLTLWYQSSQAGSNASGEFSWVYQNSESHITHLDRFYTASVNGLKMVSAYPGFKDYYKDGGWGNGYFIIDHNGMETFTTTLNKAIENNATYLQLVTWNDYGEGTMIEPTVEFQYGFLTTLQSTLGVSYTQSDLELVAQLYSLRKKFTDGPNQKKMEQVFYDIVSLKLDKARELITTVQ